MKVCQDGRVWGQNNKEAGSHLGTLTGRKQYIKKLVKKLDRIRAILDIAPVPPLLPGQVLSHASINVRKWRAAALLKLGNKCIHCGFSDVRALQIDHTNGGGSQEIHITFNDSPRIFYKAVIEDNDNKYQILCANCNQIKRIEKREV